MKSFSRKTRLGAIKAKRSGPSSNAAKLSTFIKSLMAAGTSHDKAWAQAKRLNIGGCNDE